MKQSHVVGTPRETQDPAFSLLRRGALEEELSALGIEGIESDAELAGSPALKTMTLWTDTSRIRSKPSSTPSPD